MFPSKNLGLVIVLLATGAEAQLPVVKELSFGPSQTQPTAFNYPSKP